MSVSAQNGHGCYLVNVSCHWSLARLWWGQRRWSEKGTGLPSTWESPSAPHPQATPGAGGGGSWPPSRVADQSPRDSRACSPCPDPSCDTRVQECPIPSLQSLLGELMHHGRKINTCRQPCSGCLPHVGICRHRGATGHTLVLPNELDCSLLKMGCEGGPAEGLAATSFVLWEWVPT